LVHAKAKQGSGISANANNRLSLVHWLEPFLDRIQKKNNNTKTNIARLKEHSSMRMAEKFATSPKQDC